MTIQIEGISIHLEIDKLLSYRYIYLQTAFNIDIETAVAEVSTPHI